MAKTMSSAEQRAQQFGKRFAEACGTAEGAKIQRLLDISYQDAKNYLGGRLPDPRVLLTIAERTPYSLHWLLTGEGEKFSLPETSSDTLPLARQISQLIRREVEEAVGHALSRPAETSGERRIVIAREDVLSETARTAKTQELTDLAKP